jgi:integrase
VAEYLSWRLRDGKGAATYIRKLEESYRHHVLSRFPKLGELTKDRWTQVTRELHESGTSWSTIARQTTYVSILLKWAQAQGKLETVPRLALPDSKTIRRTQKKRRALSVAERDSLLAHLRATHRCGTSLRSGRACAWRRSTA